MKGRAQKTADQGRAVIEAMRAALGNRPPDYLTALYALDKAPFEWREVATDYFVGNASAELLDIYKLAKRYSGERDWYRRRGLVNPLSKAMEYADRVLSVPEPQRELAYRLFSATLVSERQKSKSGFPDVLKCRSAYFYIGLAFYVPSAPLMELAVKAMTGVRLDLWQRTGTNLVEVELIKVPDELRGEGCFKRVLEQLTAWADIHHLTLALTPTNEFGASKTRLTKAFKRVGFGSNRNRNRDFRTQATMIRRPAGYIDVEMF